MDNFKTFYNEKNGKYILFFGFYLLFFIFLGIYMRTLDSNKPKEKQKEEVVEKMADLGYRLVKDPGFSDFIASTI